MQIVMVQALTESWSKHMQAEEKPRTKDIQDIQKLNRSNPNETWVTQTVMQMNWQQ